MFPITAGASSASGVYLQAGIMNGHVENGRLLVLNSVEIHFLDLVDVLQEVIRRGHFLVMFAYPLEFAG